MRDQMYVDLAAQAATDHREANERYAAAQKDSQLAAFRELVFHAASLGVVTVELEPSDQGDWMTVRHAPDVDGVDLVDSDDLFEAMEDGAMDLPDTVRSHWAQLPGVTYESSRRGGDKATIDITVAAPAAHKQDWLNRAPEGVTAIVEES